MSRILVKTRYLLSERFNSDYLILLALSALVILVWLPRLEGPLDLRWDAGVYYVLGTSLAEGRGYRLLNEPGDIEANQYPPLFPAIVAAYQLVLGTSDFVTVGHWLRLSFFFLFIIYISAVYLLLREHLRARYAVAATLIVLFDPNIRNELEFCASDFLYGLVTVLFFLCNRKTGRRIYPVLATILVIASYALRTIGIALLAAWVAESIINRRFKSAAIRLTLSLVPILCWQAYVFSVENSPQYNQPSYEYQRAEYLFYNVSYAKSVLLVNASAPEEGHVAFAQMTQRFVHNLITMPVNLGEAVSLSRPVWEAISEAFSKGELFARVSRRLIYLALVVLGCLTLGGVGLQLVGRQWIIPIYILVYLTLISLTPFQWTFPRLLMPMAPFIVLSLFKFLLFMKTRCANLLPAGWGARVGPSLIASTLVVILIVKLLFMIHAYTSLHQQVIYNHNGERVAYRLFVYDDNLRALDEGIDWLEARARPGDVVAATLPHWVYLRTGLKSVMPPLELNPIEAQRLLESVPVTYLFLQEAGHPVIQNHPGRWELVFSAQEGRLNIYQSVAP